MSLTLEDLREELAPLVTRLDGVDARLDSIETRVGHIEAYTNGLPVIGEAVFVLQRDTRLIRAAINDMGKTNITSGEVEAMHQDIDQVLAQLRDLLARVKTLEERT